MKIYQVMSPEFSSYGKTLGGHDVQPLLSALESATPLPEGCDYVAEEPAIQSLPVAQALGKAVFGGMAAQFGWCNGHNTKLNCLEYHRSSEFLLSTEDVILLVAREEELINYRLDTARVNAFLIPAGTLVELYATTLHYAPCHTDPAKGFRTLIILPMGTNTEKPPIPLASEEDRLLWANNKWLLAHPESAEAGEGAWVGLYGRNIDLSRDAISM